MHQILFLMAYVRSSVRLLDEVWHYRLIWCVNIACSDLYGCVLWNLSHHSNWL